jgi:F0F1-type ATP synthase delta subunit
MKYSDTLSRAETEVAELKEQLEVWVERSQRAEGLVSQQEKDLREIILRSESDGQMSMRKMKAAEDYIKELQLQLLAKTQDLDTAQEVARKLKREYQSTRQDAEGMLQVCMVCCMISMLLF